MQNHTAELTRALDRRGVLQTVVTTRLPTVPLLERLGNHARVIRLGLPIRHLRQLYALQAGMLAPVLASRADLVHVHLGEDLAILPVGTVAAKLHRLPLILTIHMSLRHTLTVTDLRSAILKLLGAPLERWGERSAEAVLAITPRLARLFVSEGVDPQRIHVVPPGVNAFLFAGPHDDPFPNIGNPRVLFVGRLAPQNGLRTLVAATRLLKSSGVQVLCRYSWWATALSGRPSSKRLGS
jgi:glycogen synthase